MRRWRRSQADSFGDVRIEERARIFDLERNRFNDHVDGKADRLINVTRVIARRWMKEKPHPFERLFLCSRLPVEREPRRVRISELNAKTNRGRAVAHDEL